MYLTHQGCGGQVVEDTTKEPIIAAFGIACGSFWPLICQKCGKGFGSILARAARL
jgi:hypothetical protein